MIPTDNPNPSQQAMPTMDAGLSAEAIPALVTAVHRERFEVSCAHGTLYARLKAAAYRDADTRDIPTVGDQVSLLTNSSGDSQIVATEPRRSLFTRKAAFTIASEQAVAANFDEVFILSSLNQEWNARRLERYATQAWQSGGLPVVVLTKCDLANNVDEVLYDAHAVAPGVDIYAVSALTGDGLDALRARLSPGKTVVLLGSSGVGKSSLVNALAGETWMRVSAIREDDARGRHTTTHRQLFTLPCGAHIIDTPGMRELALLDAEEGLREAFDDIDALAQGCRFSDCAHNAEPGCAVRQAIHDGALDSARLKSYQKLQREAARRAKQRKGGSVR